MLVWEERTRETNEQEGKIKRCTDLGVKTIVYILARDVFLLLLMFDLELLFVFGYGLPQLALVEGHALYHSLVQLLGALRVEGPRVLELIPGVRADLFEQGKYHSIVGLL